METTRDFPCCVLQVFVSPGPPDAIPKRTRAIAFRVMNQFLSLFSPPHPNNPYCEMGMGKNRMTDPTGGRTDDSLSHRDSAVRRGVSSRGYPRATLGWVFENLERRRLFAGRRAHLRGGRACFGSERERSCSRRARFAPQQRGRAGRRFISPNKSGEQSFGRVHFDEGDIVVE